MPRPVIDYGRSVSICWTDERTNKETGTGSPPSRSCSSPKGVMHWHPVCGAGCRSRLACFGVLDHGILKEPDGSLLVPVCAGSFKPWWHASSLLLPCKLYNPHEDRLRLLAILSLWEVTERSCAMLVVPSTPTYAQWAFPLLCTLVYTSTWTTGMCQCPRSRVGKCFL